MVKQIYNIILTSDLGNGTNTLNETFFYDWTQIPNVPYKFTFTFISGIGLFANTSVPTIFIDLGQSNNKFAVGQNTSTINYRSNFVGSMYYYGSGVNLQLSADLSTNPPIFLNSRPMNNSFLVEIHRNIAPFSLDFTQPPVAYTLVLNFEEL